MGKKIIRVTSNKKDAKEEAKWINVDLEKRNIKREAYVCEVSKSYVKARTRKGYPIAKKNYAICVRDIRK